MILNSDWYRRICHPIVKLMYKRDWSTATRLHQEAMFLELRSLDREDRERIRLQLLYIEFQMHIGMRRLARLRQLLPVLDEVFRTSKKDPVTDFLRRKLRLEMSLCLDLTGIRSADPDDIEKLAHNQTSQYWPFDVWIMLSYWAFSLNNSDLLIHANNRMIETCEQNSSEAWYIQRNLTMQLMLNNEATSEDLIWLISSVDILTQLGSIGGRIRLMAIDQGIWTDEVARTFRNMQDKLLRTNNQAVDNHYQRSIQLSAS